MTEPKMNIQCTVNGVQCMTEPKMNIQCTVNGVQCMTEPKMMNCPCISLYRIVNMYFVKFRKLRPV